MAKTPEPIVGNVLADASALSGVGSRVEVSSFRGCNVFTYINGASEAGVPWSPSVDCNLVRVWCTTATCVVSRLPGLTLANYNTTAGLKADQLVLSSGALLYELEWLIRANEVIYFRIAGSSHLGFLVRTIPDFLK